MRWRRPRKKTRQDQKMILKRRRRQPKETRENIFPETEKANEMETKARANGPSVKRVVGGRRAGHFFLKISIMAMG